STTVTTLGVTSTVVVSSGEMPMRIANERKIGTSIVTVPVGPGRLKVNVTGTVCVTFAAATLGTTVTSGGSISSSLCAMTPTNISIRVNRATVILSKALRN